METSFSLSTLCLLILFASSVDARKDLREYWKAVMKDQAMPISIQGVLPVDPSMIISNQKTNSEDVDQNEAQKPNFFKDFMTKLPNLSLYGPNKNPSNEKSFVNKFEPKPNVLPVYNDVKPREGTIFVKNFEPKPNPLPVYNIKPCEERLMAKDFEPDITIYHE